MTAAEMIAELQDHGFDDASDARMMAVLNDAYWDACAREPWPFLEKAVSMVVAASGTTSASWPTDFRAAQQITVSTAGAASGQKLDYMRSDDFTLQYGNDTTTGVPRVWYMIGNTAYFFPAASPAQQLYMLYLKQPAAIVDASVEADIAIPAAFHRSVIVNGALFKLYAMEDDTDIAPTFETYYERGLQNMREYCWRRQYGTQDIVHPVDSDDVGLDVGMGYWVN
jgi:hypothetical protein